MPPTNQVRIPLKYSFYITTTVNNTRNAYFDGPLVMMMTVKLVSNLLKRKVFFILSNFIVRAADVCTLGKGKWLVIAYLPTYLPSYLPTYLPS